MPDTGSLTNGLVQAGQDGISRSLVKSYHDDFGPRLGFLRATTNFIQPDADSVYNSLQVNYEKQMARNFRFQAS